ncbi:MAG: OmpA family protein [Oligoflexales bacterium]|nr:OmpA family protein [Oligoflexales bacterium]
MEEEEPEKESTIPAWIVGYADLMTLLFATFVVLYGLKPEGETKAFKGAKSSIREAFREVPEDIPIKVERGDIILGKSRFRKKKGSAVAPRVLLLNDDTEYPVRMVNKEFERIINTLTMRSKEIIAKSSSTKEIEAFSFSASNNELTLTLLGSAFYKRGSSRLNRDALQMIEPMLATVLELGKPINLAGHTSTESELMGQSAWELSAKRASSLANYITSKYRYSRSQITAAGFGSEVPVTDPGNREPNAVDDRVEIKVDFNL